MKYRNYGQMKHPVFNELKVTGNHEYCNPLSRHSHAWTEETHEKSLSVSHLSNTSSSALPKDKLDELPFKLDRKNKSRSKGSLKPMGYAGAGAGAVRYSGIKLRVSGQGHAPAALPPPREKDPRYPLDRSVGGPQSRSGRRG
jgi:hypothetical protein